MTDGTSKTLMFGEAPGTIGNAVGDDFTFTTSTFDGFAQAFAWAGWGTLPTYNGLTVSLENGNPNLESTYQAKWTHFSSAHASVVQFAMVDASVHAIATDIDIDLLHSLSTMKGEEVVQLP